VRRAVVGIAVALATTGAVQAGASTKVAPTGGGVAKYQFFASTNSTIFDIKLVGAFPTGYGDFVGTVIQTGEAADCAQSDLCAAGTVTSSVGPFDFIGTSKSGQHHLSAVCSGQEADDLAANPLLQQVLVLTCASTVDGHSAGASTLVVTATNAAEPQSSVTGQDSPMVGAFAETRPLP
jgi:hypothetical protein